MTRRLDPAAWIARLTVASVFASNLGCAVAFIAAPERYAGGFELGGVPGQIAIRGLGIAFIMWNATYPLVIWDPRVHSVMFAVVLTQQAIGLIGETWLLFALPPGHTTLGESIGRFAVFDGAGLAAMLLAFIFLRAAAQPDTRPGR